MELRLGCGHLGDEEFLRAFEECSLEPRNFHHADHIRLAWICVGREGVARAEQLLLSGLQKLAASAGVPGKFLYTTTVAWVRLVAEARRDFVEGESFQEWICRHPELLDRSLLEKHYSGAALKSEAARTSWVEPDLHPINT